MVRRLKEARMVKKIPTKIEKHGHVRADDYHWLREREDPEVIKYLNEETERAAKDGGIRAISRISL